MGRGGAEDKKKIHWKHWNELCMAKLNGGLGFKDFESYNLALLASQWWRIMSRTESLVYKVLHVKYFSRDDPMKVQPKASSSYLWRSLLAGRAVIEKVKVIFGEWKTWNLLMFGLIVGFEASLVIRCLLLMDKSLNRYQFLHLWRMVGKVGTMT